MGLVRSLVRPLTRPLVRPLVSDQFSPLDLPNLLLWLDASNLASITETAGAVSQWDDLSGNGSHVSQSTGSARPSTGVDTQNGLNGITFSAIQSLARSDSLGITGNPNLTIFVVARTATTGINRFIYIGDNADTAGQYIHTSGDSSFRYGNGFQKFDTSQIPSVGAAALEYVRPSGANYGGGMLYFDGVNKATDSTGNPANIPNLTTPGKTVVGEGPTSFFGMVMFEIVVLNAVMTADERAALHTYSADKWGTP